MVGEFEGIVGQVDQNLAQSQGIPHQRAGNVGVGAEQNFDTFLFLGFDRHQRGQILHDGIQIEINGLHVQFSGFDLGKVQNIVDNSKQ